MTTTTIADLSSAVIGGVVTTLLSSPFLWLVLRGKLSQWYVERDRYGEDREQGQKDLNAMGARIDGILTLTNNNRVDLDGTRDRVTRIEVAQTAIIQGVETANAKLDQVLAGLGETKTATALVEQRVAALERRRQG